MNVSVLNHTPDADRTVCATARGDYMSGSLVGVDLDDDSSYGRVMDDVEYDEDLVDDIEEGEALVDEELRAKTRTMIRRLLRRGHFGPFEHPSITFAVEGVSRACMAQITRHRHATFDVQSMRYVNFDDPEVLMPDSFEEEGEDVATRSNYVKSVNRYRSLVDSGVPEEDARMVLPIGTKVSLSATFSLRSLFHVIDMRHAGDAQWEIRELTEKMMEGAEEVAPISMEMYQEYAKGSSKKAP